MLRPSDLWPTRRARAGRPVSTTGLLLRFTAAGVVVLVALSGVIAWLARQAGTEQATESAREAAYVIARSVVEPRLTPQVVAGDQAALAEFDAAMREFALRGSLVRVKLWSPSGRIVYSDEQRLVGLSFDLDEEELEAMVEWGSFAEVSDLSSPENRFETSYGKLLEVYVGVASSDEQRLLFEAYFEYDAVTEAGQNAWRRFAPPSLGALLVLQLVQIPFAYSLARRVQRQQRERERLLQHAVESSDAERRRIAGDLHDGVVQELTGLNYALDAMRLGEPAEGERAALIADGAARLRRSIGGLRTLLVGLYPPDLAEHGLQAALGELAASLEQAGMQVEQDTDQARDVPPAAAALLFRCAQEMVRNIIEHSLAGLVHVTTTVTSRSARLVVDDDGRGFDEAIVARRRGEGHFGLRSLGDLVADAGGTMTVRSAPGQGTKVEVEVPLT